MTDRKISELTAATTLGGTELFPLVQSGTTKSMTATVLGEQLPFTPSGSGAVARTVQAELRDLQVNVLRFIPTNLHAGIAAKTNTTDLSTYITAAIAALPTGGGDVLFPLGDYKITTTIDLFTGVRLVGLGGSSRWGQNPAMTSFPTRILAYGAIGAGLRIKPGLAVGASGANYRNIKIHNLHVDGENATGTADGLQLDCTDANVSLQGLVVEDCMFSNFPRSQIRQLANSATGGGWSVSFNRVSAHDKQQNGSGNLVDFLGPSSSPFASVQFIDPVLVPYVSGEWALKFIGADCELLNGNIAPQAASGGNGVWITGASTIVGTHMEGIGNTGTGARLSSIAGHRFLPGYCSTWSVGLQVGDSTAAATGCENTFIGTAISGNTTDIKIEAGGSRKSTFIASVASSAVITDSRASTDGIFEVIRITNAGQIMLPPGLVGAPAIVTQERPTTGYWFDTSNGDIVWSIAGVERLRMAAASVALSITAQLYPGSGVTAYAAQTAAGILGGSGVPNNAVGNNGDFYIRSDGTVAGNTVMYHKEAGAWVALTTT